MNLYQDFHDLLHHFKLSDLRQIWYGRRYISPTRSYKWSRQSIQHQDPAPGTSENMYHVWSAALQQPGLQPPPGNKLGILSLQLLRPPCQQSESVREVAEDLSPKLSKPYKPTQRLASSSTTQRTSTASPSFNHWSRTSWEVSPWKWDWFSPISSWNSDANILPISDLLPARSCSSPSLWTSWKRAIDWTLLFLIWTTPLQK